MSIKLSWEVKRTTNVAPGKGKAPGCFTNCNVAVNCK